MSEMKNINGIFADQIFHSGKIVTVDDTFSIAESFAIKDGRFQAVGKDNEIMSLAGPKTQKCDLKGNTVIPGLIDSHIHFQFVAEESIFVSLAGVNSIVDIAKRIEEAVKKTRKGEWIRCAMVSSYFYLELEEKRRPNRWDLDHVSPDNPVYIEGPHHCYVNSYALRLAGVTRDTTQPPGAVVMPGEQGPIEKDPKTGEPTGIFREASGKSLVSKLLPPVTHSDRVKGYKATAKRLNSRGLTSILQAGALFEEFRALQEIWSKEELTLRIYSLFFIDFDKVRPLEEDLEIIQNLAAFASARGFGDDMLKIGGIGEIIFNGIMSRDKLKSLSIEAAKNNLRVGVHAHMPMGGKALDDLMEVWEEVNEEVPIADKRFIILHATFPKEDTFEKVKKMNLVGSCQNAFLYAQPEQIKLGEGRPAYSPRSWLDNGIPVGIGSDSVSSNGTLWDPFINIHHAVTRISRNGVVLKDGQNITIEEALKCYTINNAILTFEEDVKGSIQTGKIADFVVLEKDILTCPIDEVKDMRVLMTVVGGKVVYEA
ncbi:MAG: amidohydrolase [Candidatus Bathyarchaeota archaeon]|nr:amidohydrolase [Candidatus Bathyarchaeota archaeon]